MLKENTWVKRSPYRVVDDFNFLDNFLSHTPPFAYCVLLYATYFLSFFFIYFYALGDGSETTAVSDTNECIFPDVRNGMSSSPDFSCPKKAKHRYDVMKYKVEKLKKKNKQLHNQNFYLKQKVRSLEKIIGELRESNGNKNFVGKQ